MPRKQRNQKSLPAIWRVPDDLWSVIEQILAELDPPARFFLAFGEEVRQAGSIEEP